MKNGAFFLLLACSVGSFFSCHTAKKAVSTKPATEPVTAEYLLKRVDGATLQADRLSARAAIKFRSEGQSFDAMANLFWVKDSCLWVQVKKFGIEGARVLVRKDSIFVVNRLEQSYAAESLDFLKKKFDLPADFTAVEALLLGRAWLFPGARPTASIDTIGLHKIDATNPDGRFSETIWVKNDPFLLEKWTAVTKPDNQTVTARFDDWRPGPGGLGYFSFLRTVDLGGSKIEAELSDLELFPTKKFRFEIPKHYRRVAY